MRSKTVVLLSIALLMFQQPSPVPAQEWARTARIAGECRWGEDPALKVRQAAATGATVLDIHAEVPGDYAAFQNPESKLAFIHRVAARAWQEKLHTIVYVAGLECQSKLDAHTFFRDHPDWVQRDITGRPAVFDSSAAFWIAPDEEDVWISPLAPDWRKRYMQLLARVAQTGVDAVYMDIPYWMTHFEGWENTWASFDTWTVQAFRQRTGLEPPTVEALGDLQSKIFQAWLDFRLQIIKEFVAEAASAIRAASPRVKLVVELYPALDFDAVSTAGDPVTLAPVVDWLCHEYSSNLAATNRTPEDWLDFTLGLQGLRAADGSKPTWVLSYASETDTAFGRVEAGKTLAAAIILSGGNFWETGGLRMCGTTTALTFRQQIFSWINRYANLLYPTEPWQADGAGVLFSPRARKRFGMTYIDTFRVALRRLASMQVPLQVVWPDQLANFSGPYLVLSSAGMITKADREVLQQYTGPIFSIADTGANLAEWRSNAASSAAPSTMYDTVLPHVLDDGKVALLAHKYAGRRRLVLLNFTGLVPNKIMTPDKLSNFRVQLSSKASQKPVVYLPFLDEKQTLYSDMAGVLRLPVLERGVLLEWNE